MDAKATPPTALVDVVVPTYDARELILRCLESLRNPVIGRRIVVDDASGDGTPEAVRREHPDAELVELRRHRGLAHALNAGASRTTAPLLLFLNNDVIAEPGALGRLAEALLDDPSATSAGGRLIDPETGATQDSYRPRDYPGAMALTARLAGVERLFPRNPWTGGHLRRRLPDDAVVRIDQQPAGSCLLVRRECFERIGGWDERYPFWYEDVDLSRRLADLGPALYVGTAPFRHVGRHSTRSWSKVEQHRRLYPGTLLYAQGHLDRGGRLLVAAAMLLACLPRAAAHRLRGNPGAAGEYAALAGGAVALARGRPVRAPELVRSPA
jgi:N-acetylglucosaminyl-diphospho-decaprenol L-rhamnosyltransferase